MTLKDLKAELIGSAKYNHKELTCDGYDIETEPDSDFLKCQSGGDPIVSITSVV